MARWPGKQGVAPCPKLLALRSQPGWLDQNGCGSVVAEGETAAIYHADKGAASADLGYKSTFAKPHLTNTLAKGGSAGEGAHTARAAGGQLAERQGLGTKAI